MSWLRRLSNTLRTGRLRHDIDRELSFHVGERADQLRADGLNEDEALRRARMQLGNPAVQIEHTRDVDVSGAADALLRNLRYAVRALRRTPGFTLSVILTLALGIGANSAVFSAIDAVLLRPLPFPDADRLVRLSEVREGAGETNVTPVRLEDWNRLNSTFEAISGYFIQDAVDTTGDLPERLRQAVVAPRFLSVLGIPPALGRGFTDAEHRFGSRTVVQLGRRLWLARGADPAAVGRQVRSGGLSVTVVGVLPPLPFLDVDVWGPFPVDAPFAQSRRPAWLSGIGRLKPGVTIEQARADLTLVQSRLAQQYPDTDRGIGVHVEPLEDALVGGVRGSLWLLFGAVSVLLLIACSNIAALLLSRTAERAQEIAVRCSLGATRASVAGQLLTETALLVLAGAGLGVPMASAASRVFVVLAPDVPRVDEVSLDARILAYTAASAIVVAVACGLVPALRGARGAHSLAASPRTQVSPRHSLQWLLVGVQVALAVTLLAGAGLLVRSSEALARVDPGFDPSRVLVFHVTGRFGDSEGLDGLVRRVNDTLNELATLPGIEATAATSMLPGVPGQQQEQFELVEGRAGTEPHLIAERRNVSPSYFATMAIPLLHGEMCRQPANEMGPTEVMVNRRFAERYLPGRSAIGLHLVAARPLRIAGIVADARERGTDLDPIPTVYGCFGASTATPWFLVRTTGEPMAAARGIRLKLKELEPLRPVYDIAPLVQRIGGAYAQNRLRTFLLLSFSVTAMSLACIGVYGTLGHVASRRRREVGLRVALGARRGTILFEFLSRALRVVGLACAAGLALSLLFARALSGMLYGVTPSDPATLSGVVAIVTIVAALAALVPAVRASRVDPIRALQEE